MVMAGTKTQTGGQRGLLTPKEVAEQLSLNYWTVLDLLNSDPPQLEGIKLGGQAQGRRWRIKQSAVDRFLRERSNAA